MEDDIRSLLDTNTSASEAGTLQVPSPGETASAPSSTTPASAPSAAPAAPTSTEGTPVATTTAPATQKPEGQTPKTPAEGTTDPIKQNVAAVITQKAPGTWTPAAREHWNSMPQEVREEVLKREREVSRAMTQSTQARQFQQQFQTLVQPYMANLQAQGAQPLQAIQTFFNIDHQLRSGQPQTKAQLIAGLCKDFGIDLELLDFALAGQQPPANKQQAFDPNQLKTLVQQELAPIRQQFQTQNAQLLQEIEGEVDNELSTFASTHEFYNDVKEDMADIIEMGARRGVNISLTDAYERATLLSAPVRAVIEQRKTASTAQQAHVVAQQAKSGAFGIQNSAEATTTNLPAGDSIRDAIERSLAHHSGRMN